MILRRGGWSFVINDGGFRRALGAADIGLTLTATVTVTGQR